MRLHLGHLEECGLDLAREHVDAVDDEHVVGAGGDAVHDAHGASARALLGVEAGEVARAVADHGRAAAGDGGEDEFAQLAVWQRLERVWVDDLGVEVVLPDVEAGAVGAGAGDAGSGDLGEAVDVVGDDAGLALDRLAHLVGPRLGAEDAVAELRVAPEVDALLLRLVHDAEEVGGRGGDGGHAEVAHEHDLAFGVAARPPVKSP